VSDAPTITTDAGTRIGPGRLILVVGPSGVGKDTLLNLARTICAADRNIVFPRRVVTRAASEAEDNLYLTPDAFREALTQGGFAMHWEAHGHYYGLPRAIEDDICAGRTVVVNVSRTVVDVLRRAYVDVVVIAIAAPPEVLAERLAARARGSDGKIEQRLGRSVDNPVAADVTIVNVGSAEHHAQRLVGAIKGEPRNR
jgi:ribose 1,5-bisphosphokinase